LIGGVLGGIFGLILIVGAIILIVILLKRRKKHKLQHGTHSSSL
jgi:uncharacterized membrane protein